MAVVVAQLVERSIPTPEIRSWNPDIDKILSTNCINEKTNKKKKRPGMAHLKKASTLSNHRQQIIDSVFKLRLLEMEGQ